MFDPDAVAVPAQLDALMNERLGRAVETGRVLEIAVQRNARWPASGGVERDWRQRSQQLAFVREPLGDDVQAARVATRQRDAIAPVGVDVVELDQRCEPPCRPEPRLQIANRALD